MISFDYGFWVALLGVILFSNGMGILLICASWWAIRFAPSVPDDTCCPKGFWVLSKDPRLAPIEIFSGFSLLLLFGAGYYMGPACIMLAGIVRLNELYALYMDRNYTPLSSTSSRTFVVTPAFIRAL